VGLEEAVQLLGGERPHAQSGPLIHGCAEFQVVLEVVGVPRVEVAVAGLVVGVGKVGLWVAHAGLPS
jgi:hypothetical protein